MPPLERLVEPTIPVSIRYRLSARGIDLLRSLQRMAYYARQWETDDGGGPVAATGS